MSSRICIAIVRAAIQIKAARYDHTALCRMLVQEAQSTNVHFQVSLTMPKPRARAKTKGAALHKDNGHADKRSKQVHSDTSGTTATISSGASASTLTPTPAPAPTVATTNRPMPTVFNLQTGVSIATRSNPPSVVAVVPGPAPNEVNLDHESKTWFEACQRNGRMDNEEMLNKDIGSYVRYELFPKLKFIMNSKQLNYSSEKSSICGLICHAMGLVDEKTSVSWWERYKDMIADVLNAKRADVTGALKRVFLRKLLLLP